MKPVVFAFITLASAALARHARADEQADRARVELDAGVRRFELGDWEGALAAFRRADALLHSPTIVFNIGRAEEKLGNVQAAIDAYETYLAMAGTSGDLGLAASVAVAELKSQSVRLRVESEPAGAKVDVDGRTQREQTPLVVFVRPGTHRVRVVLRQAEDVRVVDANAIGTQVDVRFVMQPAPSRDLASERASTVDDYRAFIGGGPALVTYHFLGTPKSPLATRFADHTNVTLGASIEGALRVVPRLYVGVDAVLAVGTYGSPNYVVGGGLGVLYRFDFGLWWRLSATVASIDSNKSGRVLATDVVLGPSIELVYELTRSPSSAWVIGAGACLLPADAFRNNDALFFPLRLGFRAM